MKLLISGFIQVFLVVLNTYFISKDYIIGIAVASFLISLTWSFNVKKIAFGAINDRLLYAFGAMLGSVLAFYLGKLIIK